MKLRAVSGRHVLEIEILPVAGNSPRKAFNLTMESPGCSIRDLRVDLLDFRDGRLTFQLGRKVYDLLVERTGDTYRLRWRNDEFSVELTDMRSGRANPTASSGQDGVAVVRALMPGKVIRLLKTPGETVMVGEGIVVVEAMKMQNEIRSPREGIVRRIDVVNGGTVNSGDVLFEVH